jgi:hypothetical protein
VESLFTFSGIRTKACDAVPSPGMVSGGTSDSMDSIAVNDSGWLTHTLNGANPGFQIIAVYVATRDSNCCCTVRFPSVSFYWWDKADMHPEHFPDYVVIWLDAHGITTGTSFDIDIRWTERNLRVRRCPDKPPEYAGGWPFS